MALADRFQERYSATRVRALTNPDRPVALTVDTGRLTAASTDAEAEFRLLAGVAYDEALPDHVAAAVLGVEWKLLVYSGTKAQAATRAWETFRDACVRVARAGGGRDRVAPRTSLPVTTSQQAAGTLPDFDRDRWDDVVPDMPGGVA